MDTNDSMLKSLEDYLQAADKGDLEDFNIDIQETVLESLSNVLNLPKDEIPKRNVDKAYDFIKKEFEEGAEAIRHNKFLGYQPIVSSEDLAYKITDGILNSCGNFYSKRDEGMVFNGIVENQNKNNFDFYDDPKDNFIYELYYGLSGSNPNNKQFNQ